MQPPAGLDEEQHAGWLHDADFLAQLVDSNKARSLDFTCSTFKCVSHASLAAPLVFHWLCLLMHSTRIIPCFLLTLLYPQLCTTCKKLRR